MVLPANQQALIEAIEQHLASHPQAADSVEGAARWWLGAPGVPPAIADVEQALGALVQQGRLRQVQLADGTVLYSRAQGPTQ